MGGTVLTFVSTKARDKRQEANVYRLAMAQEQEQVLELVLSFVVLHADPDSSRRHARRVQDLLRRRSSIN